MDPADAYWPIVHRTDLQVHFISSLTEWPSLMLPQEEREGRTEWLLMRVCVP